MKTISLLRHGESPQTPSDDINRKLNKNGIDGLKRLAKNLIEENHSFDYILCSPAQRTVDTMNMILSCNEKKIEVQFLEKLYSYKGNNLEQFIEDIDNSFYNILIVGHNPLISRIAYNIDEDRSNISFSPGTYLRFEVEIDNWDKYRPHTGNIISHISPNK